MHFSRCDDFVDTKYLFRINGIGYTNTVFVYKCKQIHLTVFGQKGQDFKLRRSSTF